MSGTREKLIELIASKVCDTYSEACEEWLPHDCGKCYANNCHIAEIADHLIANGVVVSKMETATIATDNPVGDKWIPVTERLPDENERVLACYINPLRKDRPPRMMVGEGTSTQIVKGKVYLWCGGWRSITHWMPLPEPPKENEYG